MADKPLKLNSISRFSKRSNRLVLEEHGHCEVPAGCGGAILRWVNPEVGFTCRIVSEVLANNEQFAIDGKPARTTPFLSIGRHVLTIVCPEVDTSSGFLILALAALSTNPDKPKATSGSWPDTFCILSSPNEAWRCSSIEPDGETWSQLDFDDSQWSTLVAKSLPPPKYSGYFRERLAKMSAVALGVEGIDGPATLWVRKEFEVTKP